MKRFDALVLGAGPAGLSSALYLARFGVQVALVEKLAPGGLLLQTFEIENYPGFAKPVPGYELADAMSAQADGYPNLTRISGEVTGFTVENGLKKVCIDKEWIEAEVVVVCTGVRYRKMGLPREDEFLGKGISHCALCDGNFFRNQVIGVVGGGNSALEESMHLAKIVSRLHLIHRRDEFRAAQLYVDRLTALGNVQIEYSSVITELHGDSRGLEAVTLKRLADGGEEVVPMNGLFVFIGFEPAAVSLPEGLKTDERGFIETDIEMRTNIPGIFAAGDIRAKMCRQVVTAVGDGATAANSAHSYLENPHG